MELIPSIDLLDGKVVRLRQGDYQRVTVYDDDPSAVASRFADAGARRIHVVDLDGAREGTPCNVAAVERIVGKVSHVPIQVGGGIRTEVTARRWMEAGVERVVLGTAAVKHPEMVEALCSAHAGRIVVAVDAKGENVAVEGWTEDGGRLLSELAMDVSDWGAAAILYTCIARDGMAEGPDVAGTCALQGRVNTTVIASGGIGSVDHLMALRDAGVRSAVCGRAIYAGDIDLAAALSALGEG